MENNRTNVDPLLVMRILHDEKLSIECIADSARVLNRLLRPLCLSKDARIAMDSISNGCEHLLQTYRHLNESAIIRELCPRNTDLCALMRRSTALHSAMAIERDIRLNCRCPNQPIVASVDPLLIERMINNLVSNALKYTPRGGIVTAKLARHEKRISISVRNSGDGIPEAILPHIFEPHVLGPQSTGSGLGLANVKLIVEMHGGSVRCASRDGVGTLMVAALPI